MKSIIEIEALVINICERAKRSEPLEDFRVELKSEWPDPQKTARQIAAHANAASPQSLLWVVGINENSCTVPGVASFEFSNWWPRVASQFDGLPPKCTELVVPYGDVSVIALSFETDRSPYVTRNPLYGQPSGGPVEWEIPWREGASTRSARRHEIVSMLSQAVPYPDIEVITASFSAVNANGRLTADFNGLFYLVPRSPNPIVIPFHRCFVNVDVEELPSFGLLNPYYISPCTKDGFQSDKYENSIKATSTELIINGPGMVRFQASAPISTLPTSFGSKAVVEIHMASATARQPFVFPIEMILDHEQLCVFRHSSKKGN